MAGRSSSRSSPTATGSPPVRSCAVCGRTIEWRRKWARDWASVRYCSAGCRKAGLTETDRSLETAIGELLARRSAAATNCPSEAARLVAARTSGDGEEWRTLMEPARRAARRLVARGEVEVTQGGVVVDPSRARGPIRIRRAR